MSGLGRRARALVWRTPILRRGAAATRTAIALERSLGIDLRYDDADVLRHEVIDRKHFLRRCFTYLTFNQIPGDYVEFGCNGAMTFRMAWSASRLLGSRTMLWGFDSFEGLPAWVDELDRHPQWVEGTMATSVEDFHRLCRQHGMAPDEYRVVQGFYENSLRGEGMDMPSRISLAYIDCDLYSSTVEVLRFLLPRLTPGMLIAFDDWFCASDERPSGERLAAADVLDHDPTWTLMPYQHFGWHGMSFVVERRR